MKRLSVILLMVLFMFVAVFGDAEAGTTNKAIAKQWAKAHYPNKVIKVVGYGKVPSDRKGKVYIERIPTVSKGGYKGKTPDGYFVKYAKKVKKGKKEICYAVYNPNNNYSDDVVCFVSCHKAKADNSRGCP